MSKFKQISIDASATGKMVQICFDQKGAWTCVGVGYRCHRQANFKAKKPDWVKYGEASLKLVDLGLSAGFTDPKAAEQVLVLVDSVLVEINDLLSEQLEG